MFLTPKKLPPQVEKLMAVRQSPDTGKQAATGKQYQGKGKQSQGTGKQYQGKGKQSQGKGKQAGTDKQSPGTGKQSPGTGKQSQGIGKQSLVKLNTLHLYIILISLILIRI